MRPPFLFPSWFKYIGWLLAVPGMVLGYFVIFWQYSISGFELMITPIDKNVPENFTNELAIALSITGLMFIIFAKVKNEGHAMFRLRSEAMFWSIRLNYFFYALYLLFWDQIKYSLETWFGYVHTTIICGPDFSSIDLVSPLIICAFRYSYLIHRSRKDHLAPIKLLPYKPYHIIGKWVSVIIISYLCFGYFADKYFNYKTPSEPYISYVKYLPFAFLLWINSSNKTENEHSYDVRILSLVYAIYINFGLLLVSNLLFYGFDFLFIEYINMVSIPIIFIICFRYQLYRSKNRPDPTIALA